MSKPAIRVLLAKPGLDTHEGGVKLVAAALRDAGMEVIYAGVFQSSESIVATALEEDVDVVGLSFLSGAHLALTRDIVAGLEAAGLGDRAVICGGIIPDDDVPDLESLGVKGIYGPGTALERIVGDVRTLVAP